MSTLNACLHYNRLPVICRTQPEIQKGDSHFIDEGTKAWERQGLSVLIRAGKAQGALVQSYTS